MHWYIDEETFLVRTLCGDNEIRNGRHYVDADVAKEWLDIMTRFSKVQSKLNGIHKAQQNL